MHRIEHFIPARETSSQIPLQRFLDPLPLDILDQYLSCYTAPGELAIDPMAQTPALPIAATRLDAKSIVSNFNPINALMLRGMLALPAAHDIDAATMRLGDSLKRTVPLRDHINQLYASTCGSCSVPVIVQRFLWDGDQNRPLEKYYHCPHCADDGHAPVDDSDLETLDAMESQGVHFWYLLERLAQSHDPERRLAEELLQLYTPRNLYALTDVSMKIEALFADSPLQTTLHLILLWCLDSCSKLAEAPLPRATAFRLQPPSRFVERNVWHAFEEAYRHIRQLAPSEQVSLCSDLDRLVEEPETQALVLNEPLRDVADMLPPSSVSLVISAPQAYYRPFWTLSFLWSGWLWGRHKAALLKPLLRRKTMGWSWYRRTLATALETLHRPLKPQGKMVFLLEGADLTHVTNAILATIGAAFNLDRVLYQPQDSSPPRHPMQGVPGAYRLTFSKGAADLPHIEDPSPEGLSPALLQSARQAITELLRERGEALHLGWIHSAVYQHWARNGLLREALLLDREMSAADYLQQQLETSLEEGLETQVLELLPEDPDDPEAPQLWWLAGKGYPPLPLGDRLEEAVWDALRQEADLELEQLEDSIYSRFPGRFTPGPGLLEKCIQSYGVLDEASGKWRLHAEDDRENLLQESDAALVLLTNLGRRLGYEVWSREDTLQKDRANGIDRPPRRLPTGTHLAWERGEMPSYLFAIKQTARLGDILSGSAKGWEEAQRYIVICERRQELLRFRMETGLLLRRALVDGGWRFIKLNHLRALSVKRQLDRQDLTHFVGLEPLIERPEAQLPLFS